MQFELSRPPDPGALAAVLRALDPRASLAFDASNDILDVRAHASHEQVLAALREAGYDARPLRHEIHVSGGSTCCGGCS